MDIVCMKTCVCVSHLYRITCVCQSPAAVAQQLATFAQRLTGDDAIMRAANQRLREQIALGDIGTASSVHTPTLHDL
jgi:hypothetical protein